MITRKTRPLSRKGQMMFEETSNKYQDTIGKLWSEVEDVLISCSKCETLNDFRTLESDIKTKYRSFCTKVDEYKGFLERANTETANKLLQEQSDNLKKCAETVSRVKTDIADRKQELVEVLSQVTRGSKGSNVSAKKAKAEAEKVKLDYIKREGELLKQKAELDANISIVKQEAIVAAAETEIKYLEEEDLDHDLGTLPYCMSQNVTANYINSLPITTHQVTPDHESNNDYTPTNTRPYDLPKVQFDTTTYQPTPPTELLTQPVPSYQPVTESRNFSSTSPMSEITKFILRKDFLLSRFTNFDDKPESYEAWRASFQSIIRELGVSPFEEMDLLIKWLGPQSSQFAKSIRVANVYDPPKGVARIWERLRERYGRPEMVEQALKTKLALFPTLSLRDNKKLYDLLDILTEVESAMINPCFTTLLSYYNSSSGVNPIVAKLPHSLQEKWMAQASNYKKSKSVPFPPFSFFVRFVRDMCEMRNDPALSQTIISSGPQVNKSRPPVIARKQDITQESVKRCPIHKAGHTLNDCRQFKKRSFNDRLQFLRDRKMCFRCCESNDHMSKDCKVTVKCDVCGNNRHATAMHIERDSAKTNTEPDKQKNTSQSNTHNSGESTVEAVTSRCTTLCGDLLVGRSCGKTVLVDVYLGTNPKNKLRVYATIDDQSNRTLATPELFEKLKVVGEPSQYTLSSCSGRSTLVGRHAKGLFVESIDKASCFELPYVIECDSIPSVLPEVPTPDVAMAYPYLRPVASHLPPLDPSVKVELLIGRDLPGVHHIQDQIVGGIGQPFAQKLPLGWVIIGNVCLGKVHAPSEINVRKTHVLNDGRPTTFPPCEMNILIQEQNDHIFVRTQNDNKIAPSVEDKQFLKLMDSDFKMDCSGHWSAPLPFKPDKPPMPNNRKQAWKRALLLDTSLRKNKEKQEHFMAFMSKVLNSDAAEVAPTSIPGECWYLPLFGVYHPKKPGQIRGVFDSSAIFEGISLNQTLMSGPDLTNSLVGILMRFRRNSVAITGDIEQMFYQFRVEEKHRDYLRFFWYRNNNITQPLIEYRMKVHVFGNTPSPSVATYGLRKAVSNSDDDVRSFVCNDFYVDDGLASLTNSKDAISLLHRTQTALSENGKIRFHKIISNDIEVMKSFPSEDLGKDLKDLDLGSNLLPTQSSLGLSWNLNTDMFIFNVNNNEKPVTRRGILSTINSLFDPLGFLAPLVISGKILLREIVPPGTDWDEPLSENHGSKWLNWLRLLKSIRDIQVPRMIVPYSLSLAHNVEVHIFSDASEQAISSVAYLKVITENKTHHIGFAMGKSKLAPSRGHTIPRLELCSSVLATEIGESVCTYLDLPLSSCHYYTDSMVVLGYINNSTRRFYTYVANRVEKIHRTSKPSQWSYVPTAQNPADLGTRFISSPDTLHISQWIEGPKWLLDQTHSVSDTDFPLVCPQNDKEIRQDQPIVARTTNITSTKLLSERFSKFSTWKSLINAFMVLKQKARMLKGNFHSDDTKTKLLTRKETEKFIIRQIQKEVYNSEIESLQARKPISKESSIVKLDPFLDNDHILRVGGRLKHSTVTLGEKNPLLIPGKSHIAKLIVLHFHQQVQHQGRHLTEGCVRSSGYWITGCKRLVHSVISNCVLCRRFRGNLLSQKMADLPEARVKACPPFTYVGVDCFGPWNIVTRKTRGGSVNSKRWAVLFCCLSCRAVHIEVLEEMSTSSLINALRRFISIRGQVKEFFSDRGTNFIGGAKELGIVAHFDEVKSFLQDRGTIWNFNTPYSSHMGGSWERLIGIARRILDAILFNEKHKRLTHEVLCTFMAETTAIMNSRPLVEVSSDPDSPCILSPSALLTFKGSSTENFSNLDTRDIYVNQWKFAQVLANEFWSRWRQEYLHTLQTRRKWQCTQDNIKEGDVVLVKDTDTHRNEWKTGLIEHVFPGRDNLVRKVLVRTIKDGQPRVYVRPIVQLVFLQRDIM